MTDPSADPLRSSSPQTVPDGARQALERALQSKEFKGSDRMRAFLSYVVNEAIDGRGDAIRAKTVAMDVYGYKADELAAREGVVRVDAGRVRRKLTNFYKSEGADEEIVISLPVGSYAPVFLSQKGPAKRDHRRTFVALAAGACVVAIGGLLAYGLRPEPSAQSGALTPEPQLYDVSPARIEAVNLAEAGRDLIFPAVDEARLRPAFLLFEAAMEKDPHYFGGYAGAAQIETTRALLQPDMDLIAALNEAANEYSATALDMAPSAPWALSARAWFEFATGNFQDASLLSERAVSLAPDDPHIAEFDALISLYTEHFDRILNRADQFREFAGNSRSNVFGNALGAAQFHTGDYPAAIRTFNASIRDGGPFGPIATAYIMAAYWQNGDHDEARRLAGVFMDTWPGFPIRAIKTRTFKEPEPVEQLIAAMQAAGWTDEN